jgi:hypothetical protein
MPLASPAWLAPGFFRFLLEHRLQNSYLWNLPWRPDAAA